MISYTMGDNVFGLNVNDVVFVKTGLLNGRTGYFGIIKNVENVRYNKCCTEQPRNVRRIDIYSPSDRTTHNFFATSNLDAYKGITKIPEDLCSRHVMFRGDLAKVVYVDIYHKPYCIKVWSEKYGYEWVTLDTFFELDWSEDEVQKVKTAEIFEEFQNKTYNEMTRDVKIISMCYRSDFENLENGDRIVLKENLCLNGGPSRYSLAHVTYNYKDHIGFKLTDKTFFYSIKTLKNGNCLKCGFLKVPSSIKAGNTLWYEGNPAIIIKTPVLMSDDYMFSIEVFETVNKHHEVPVNTENYHKCVWNNVNNKLKEAEKTGKAFKGVEFYMTMPFIFDRTRLDEILAREKTKMKLNEKYGWFSRPENQIVINTDGVKVTYARCGDLVASSKCHDDDKFDAWTGAKIALERLEKKFIEKAEREKKEKLLNNWYDSLTEEKKEFVKKKLQEEK